MNNNNEYLSINEAQKVIEAELKLMSTLQSYWCLVTGREGVDHETITIMRSYVDRFGMENVLLWIKRAHQRCKDGADDKDMGRYISGIVRRQVDIINELDDVEGGSHE